MYASMSREAVLVVSTQIHRAERTMRTCQAVILNVVPRMSCTLGVRMGDVGCAIQLVGTAVRKTVSSSDNEKFGSSSSEKLTGNLLSRLWIFAGGI